MALLTVDNLTKSFGGLTAVSNVHMTINEGELIGLIPTPMAQEKPPYSIY